MGSETVVKQLKAASGYPGVKAILFRVASGGGSALASDDELRLLRQLGVEWAMLGVPDQSLHSVANYKAWTERFARFDIQIYRIGADVHVKPQFILRSGPNAAGHSQPQVAPAQVCRFYSYLVMVTVYRKSVYF